MRGFLIAAPHSGSGKTVVTLGLLRAFKKRGVAVVSAKAGPDYIDPAFHAVASSGTCINLDPWAMRRDLLDCLTDRHAEDADMLVVEGMMGLFDGAADGTGTAADLATRLGLPIVLVVDASRMAHSIAALVNGYALHRADINIAGVILNRVGSVRHEKMLRDALAPTGIEVLGVICQYGALVLPERHLGLVQAGEHAALESFIETAAAEVTSGCDLNALASLPIDGKSDVDQLSSVPPLGQKIAIARDRAFSFIYPHLLDGWHAAGAEVAFFSPLADEGPSGDADAVYLPGGYPELHATTIANASRFKAGMINARNGGASVYGECGGYMVLGNGIMDAEGTRHEMLGFLDLETSFADRKRNLGYRRLTPRSSAFFCHPMTAHEFHYSTVMHECGEPLFDYVDATGEQKGAAGLIRDNVAGSFMHLIDLAEDT
ncbi:MAG: cobyrinate a,c-diamide synthase [Pseudomonadota bacterium]